MGEAVGSSMSGMFGMIQLHMSGMSGVTSWKILKTLLDTALRRHVWRRNDEGSRRSSKRAWNGNGRSVSDGDWRSEGSDGTG